MKAPIGNELRTRIKLLKRRYSDANELKEMFFATTKGYSKMEFYALLKEKKKEYIQKIRECYFCFEKKVEEHHINYDPERLVYLCATCHNKIHFVMEEYHKDGVKKDRIIKDMRNNKTEVKNGKNRNNRENIQNQLQANS